MARWPRASGRPGPPLRQRRRRRPGSRAADAGRPRPSRAASSSWPRRKWPKAVAICMAKICGSCGLRRMARAACSIAASGSPRNALASALKCQTQARLGLSAERPLEQGRAVVELADDDDRRHAGIGQRHRVVTPELGGAPRQPPRLGDLRPGRPPSRSPCAAGSSARPCRRRRRSRGSSSIALANSASASALSARAEAMERRHAAQEVVVGVEALGRLALGALDLGLLEPRRDRADHARGHPVLQVEDVGELAVEPVGPQMRAGRRVDQLAGDAHAARPPCARCPRARSARPARGRPASRRRRGPCR